MTVNGDNILTGVKDSGVVYSKLDLDLALSKGDFGHKDVFLKGVDIGHLVEFDFFTENLFYAVSTNNDLYLSDLNNANAFIASRSLGSFKPVSMAIKTLSEDVLAVINDEGVIDM